MTEPARPDESPSPPAAATPVSWRLAIAAAVLILGTAAYLLQHQIGLRGQAIAGLLCFFGLVAMCSSNLRLVNWRTVGWGILLQAVLGVLLLKIAFVRQLFEVVRAAVVQLISFSDRGAEFVFGNLARPGDLALNPGKEFLFIFAFKALPPILFIAALSSLLYHWNILQRLVGLFARLMVYFMRTSGAETLSVAANVIMGQTEAPLIVRPYVPRMTGSELFTLMASGMAHISGAMMVVYINYGADPVGLLTSSIMACPCSLYLSKVFLPEAGRPETSGTSRTESPKSPYVNGIDAIVGGTTEGLKLALNVAAMLIVFIALVAMADAILGAVSHDLSLAKLFGWIFSPAAFLMGVEAADVAKVGSLLGSKLAINEHYAFLLLKGWKADPNFMTARSYILTCTALSSFANFGSVGIQLGGIGALAPERRHDLARLGLRALFVGFVVTLLNAAFVGVLLE